MNFNRAKFRGLAETCLGAVGIVFFIALAVHIYRAHWSMVWRVLVVLDMIIACAGTWRAFKTRTRWDDYYRSR